MLIETAITVMKAALEIWKSLTFASGIASESLPVVAYAPRSYNDYIELWNMLHDIGRPLATIPRSISHSVSMANSICID